MQYVALNGDLHRAPFRNYSCLSSPTNPFEGFWPICFVLMLYALIFLFVAILGTQINNCFSDLLALVPQEKLLLFQCSYYPEYNDSIRKHSYNMLKRVSSSSTISNQSLSLSSPVMYSLSALRLTPPQNIPSLLS